MQLCLSIQLCHVQKLVPFRGTLTTSKTFTSKYTRTVLILHFFAFFLVKLINYCLISGTPGPDGESGEDGCTGKDGLPGFASARGKSGLDGQNGQKGRKGQKGVTGLRGAPGPRGSYRQPDMPLIKRLVIDLVEKFLSPADDKWDQQDQWDQRE
jgi:hypothetical protein